MKKVSFLALLFLFSSAHAQDADDNRRDSSRIIGHVYEINFWKSFALTIGSELLTFAGSRLPLHDKPDITNQEFDLLQSQTSRDQVNPIDRLALNIGLPSRDYTYTAAYFQTFCAAAPLALLFGDKFRKNWDDIILLMGEVNAINMFTFQFSPFGPFFQKRYRPIAYYAVTQADRDAEKVGSNRVSFYSGHTSAATASLFLMAKIYCDYNPEIHGWGKIGVFAIASIPPLIMGYLRLIALRHFPSDILMGGIVGGTIGIVVPELHRITGRDLSIGAYTSPESTGIKLAWNLK